MTRSTFFILLLCIPLLMMAQKPFEEDGEASYYGSAWHGRRTADGGIYDKDAHICAHKTLPFGTRIKVTKKKNGKFTIVTVTDRGPFGPGRIVDLSNAGARDIDIIRAGVAPVHLEVLPPEMDVEEVPPTLSEQKDFTFPEKTIKVSEKLKFPMPIQETPSAFHIDSLTRTFGKLP